MAEQKRPVLTLKRKT
ncbi:hypothetical protein BFK68_RS26425, partial [Escherichia coli]